jgi:hypothetical protein
VNKEFKIGDYIKLTNPNERDLFRGLSKNAIGIIKLIDNETLYVEFSNRDWYAVDIDQIEFYKERCVESIILAHGITKSSLVKSIANEIKQYISDNFDKKFPIEEDK